ncbi:MAG TPA: hypothetical protein VLB44_08895 [Kofleriaceae bacterium]|nr:hypothetical protein [Kofleriaceae bacterium]
MVNRMVVAALLWMAACDRGATSNAPDCAAASSALIGALSGPKDRAAPAGTVTPDVKPALVSLCKSAKWSDDARSCIAKAGTAEQQRDCWYKHLTGEQSDALQKAAAPLSMSNAAAMRKMHEFADKMCACKDPKCAQDVSDEMVKWSQEMSKQMKEPPKLSDAEMKEATELGERMGKCMQTAMGAGMPELPDKPTEGDIDPTTGRPISK